MPEFKVKGVYGGRLTIKDCHGDPVDGIQELQKYLPSSVREELLKDCQKENISEVLKIVRILCYYYSKEEI